MGTIYVQAYGPELSGMTNFYDSADIDSVSVANADANVNTPYAVACLADGHGNAWAPHMQARTAEMLARQPGWKLLRWAWSAHGAIGDEAKNYRVLLFGKAYDKPPTGNKIYSCPYFGCSFKSFQSLNEVLADTNKVIYKCAPMLKMYAGKPLTAEEYRPLYDRGWRKVPGTSVLMFGERPSDLPAKHKERFRVED